MKKSERIARVLAFQLTGYDPDSKVIMGEPERVGGKFVLMDDRFATPLWRHYLGAADAVIAEMENQTLDFLQKP